MISNLCLQGKICNDRIRGTHGRGGLCCEKMALVKEAYDKDPSAQKFFGTDDVTMIFGADRKGYIRGMGAGVSKTQLIATAFMNAKVQEEKDNVRKEKQKNKALKAQLDAERQRSSAGLHDQISNSSYQQILGSQQHLIHFAFAF
ncbi:hypothetical protein MKX01_017284 [Papaver californicum]|nr:hypothetical protein MKX01_017284 [Papaver californicum]